MNIADLYQKEIIEHSKYPRNFGKLAAPDISYKENNPLCGDEIEIQLKLNSAGRVKQSAFHGEGCSISRASASMLTEVIKGKNIKDLKELSGKDVLKMLGINLTPARLKCALLPLVALKKGLNKENKKINIIKINERN